MAETEMADLGLSRGFLFLGTQVGAWVKIFQQLSANVISLCVRLEFFF